MDVVTPVDWSVVARNLPEHAGNPIHTDAGARAAGFPSALVAGVTTYAYLTHPLVEAWGVDWLVGGGGEVRFLAPVVADATVECVVSLGEADGDVRVDAVGTGPGRNPRATLSAWHDIGPEVPRRAGEPLPSRRVTLSGEYGAGYGRRAGDDLDIYERDGLAHPAAWPAIANAVMRAELVRGPWIHTRSIVWHHAPGQAGATVDVHAAVVDRFERRGRRAILEVRIEHDGRPLATLEHEAIVELDPIRR